MSGDETSMYVISTTPACPPWQPNAWNNDNVYSNTECNSSLASSTMPIISAMKLWGEETPFTSLVVPEEKRIGVNVMIHDSFNLVKKRGEMKEKKNKKGERI